MDGPGKRISSSAGPEKWLTSVQMVLKRVVFIVYGPEREVSVQIGCK